MPNETVHLSLAEPLSAPLSPRSFLPSSPIAIGRPGLRINDTAQFAIRNPQSSIRNPQSAIRNPQSSLLTSRPSILVESPL
jgi:major type 1 subunit fimbrin (pilin)